MNLWSEYEVVHNVFRNQSRPLVSAQDAWAPTTPSQILCKIILSELSQISTNCKNFWHKDGNKDKFMSDALIFHLT